MNHPAPKFDGSVRMSPIEVRQAMKARVIAMKERGMRQVDIARHFGITQQRVSQLVRMDLPDTDSLHSRARLCSQRQRVINLAKDAKSLGHLCRLSGRGRSFVTTTLSLFAPEELARIHGGVKEAPKPDPVAIDWQSRAHALFPDDEALARSLARAASFVATTKDGVTVRLVPPRNEGVAA